MKLERYCIPFMFLAAMACNTNTEQKKSEDFERSVNTPSASEQIANEQIERRNESITKTVVSGDHRFTVSSEGDGALRSFKLAVVNLKGDTTKADSIDISDVKGFLKDISVADLDKDGNPEVYCFTQSKGTEMGAGVYAVAYVKGKAVSIQPADANKIDMEGYRGRDSFYVKAPYVIRTFPLYKEADVQTTPSGGNQTIKYKLENYKLVATK